MRDTKIGHINLEEILVCLEQRKRTTLEDKVLHSGLAHVGDFPEVVQSVDLVIACARGYILET